MSSLYLSCGRRKRKTIFEDGEKKLMQSENRVEVFPSHPKASESFQSGKARRAMCFDWNGVKFGALKYISGLPYHKHKLC